MRTMDDASVPRPVGSDLISSEGCGPTGRGLTYWLVVSL
jgi:hypothetical protein